MSTRAKNFLGTQVAFASVDAPTVFTSIEEVTNIQQSGSKQDDLDATSMDSTGGAREYVPGLLDFGSLQIDYLFVPEATGQQALVAMGRVSVNWKITLPDDAGEITFKGHVSDPSTLNLPMDKLGTRTVKIKVSGEPDENFGS